MAQSNEKLIALAVAGDAAALVTLLQDSEPRLKGYVRRRLPMKVKCTIGTDDVVQDVCYEACRLIRGFVPQHEDSFPRWLMCIANNRIRSAIKKYRARRTSQDVSINSDDDDEMLGVLAQLSTRRRTPSSSAAAHEFVAAVERSLGGIHSNYREVITHRFIDCLSVEETAARMRRSNDEVYVLASRALSALRKQLASVSHFR